MARLQDFQTVTPSATNDKLLIVQAAGQGIATIKAVGDTIFGAETAGSLSLGSTTPSGSTAEAIKTNKNHIGTLSNLTTTTKSSLVEAVNEVDKAETLYSKNTFNNDIGTALALTGYDLRNYKFISITGYISSISSSSRFTILICNNKSALSANYYPICVNEALGFARFESTNASLKLLVLKINGSAPTGGATITEVIGLVG